MDYFKFLPVEIKLDILSRLPTKTALDCKLVCTNWRDLVRHPSFSKMHLRRSNNPSTDDADFGKLSFVADIKCLGLLRNSDKFHYLECNENHDETCTTIERIRRIHFTSPFNETVILGSCNGLICLSSGNWRPEPPRVCIYNPITREYVVLPGVKSDYLYPNHYRTNGFGYVSSTNEYKVVVVCMLKTEFVEVHIYTLGSGNGWRNLGNFDSKFGQSPLSDAVFANGALYWMIYELEMIQTFDLAEEKFCEHLSPPPLPPGSHWYLNSLGVLDGCLFYSYSLDREEKKFQHIWVLRKEKDSQVMKEREEHQSFVWSREFRIDQSNLLAVTKTGGVLTYSGNYFNIYNPKASTSKTIVDFKEWICQVFPHKNTLVSLKELGEEDTKTMESVEVEDTKSRNQPSKQL